MHFSVEVYCPPKSILGAILYPQVVKIDAETDSENVEKIMPKRIQNDEQLNQQRMQHRCISWKGVFAKHMRLAIFFKISERRGLKNTNF